MNHTSPTRRALAAVAILGAAALALSGCLASPPALPTEAPPQPTETQAVPETEAAEPTQSQETTPPAAGEYAYTVDDGAGDTWAFSVTSIDDDPPMERGDAAPGTFLVAVRIDGDHVEGNADFDICFDVMVVGSDGSTYDRDDTPDLRAQDDIYSAGETFRGARAVVQLPQGVDPVQIIISATYGGPDVEDVVLDVER